MRLLLDTQVWLWLQVEPRRVPPSIMAMLTDAGNDLLLSAASSWEIAIKVAVGKLDLPEPPATYVPDRMRRSGVMALPVSHPHALAVAALPHHHRDPFDRLLIAQAQVERLTLITADPVFGRYGVPVHLIEQ